MRTKAGTFLYALEQEWAMSMSSSNTLIQLATEGDVEKRVARLIAIDLAIVTNEEISLVHPAFGFAFVLAFAQNIAEAST